MSPIGALTKSAIRMESDQGMANASYPTSVAEADDEEVVLGAYDMVPLLNESLTENVEASYDETLVGGAGVDDSDIISHLVNGGATFQGHYDGIDPVFAAALGFENQAQSNGGVSPEFLNSNTSTINSTGQTSSNIRTSDPLFSSSSVGKFVRITSGSGAGQVRRISSYVNSGECGITPNWSVTPSSGDALEVSDEFRHIYECANLISDILWTTLDDDASGFTYSVSGIGTSSDQAVRRFSFGIDKQQSLWMFRGAFVTQLTIEVSVQNGVQITANLVPFDVSRNSTKNTSASTWAWSASTKMATINKRILFQHGVFRIADYSTSGLSSGDLVGVKSFSLVINNNLINNDQDSVSGRYIKMPVRNGLREITGSFELARYNSDVFHTDLTAETLKMADYKFTGASMGNNNKAFNMYMPRLKITNAPSPVKGKGLLDQTIEFRVFNGSETVTDMPTPVMTSPYSPVYIETINRNPFNQLLDQNQEY